MPGLSESLRRSTGDYSHTSMLDMEPREYGPNGHVLRYTGNYFDQIKGRGYHSQHLTLHEFMETKASLFMVDPAFMQIPGYVQKAGKIPQVEDVAREWVSEYIFKTFEHHLLGMQDYERWGVLFEQRCADVCPGFWGQVNMLHLMMAHELVTDENQIDRIGTNTGTRVGGTVGETVQHSVTKVDSKTTEDRTIENKQLTDAATREAAANISAAGGLIDAGDVSYDLGNAADSYRETRARTGDTIQKIAGAITGDSKTTGDSTTNTTQTAQAATDTQKTVGGEHQLMTNKQFMLERQWAIQTARDLLPLSWLYAQLRPCFYLVY